MDIMILKTAVASAIMAEAIELLGPGSEEELRRYADGGGRPEDAASSIIEQWFARVDALRAAGPTPPSY